MPSRHFPLLKTTDLGFLSALAASASFFLTMDKIRYTKRYPIVKYR